MAYKVFLLFYDFDWDRIEQIEIGRNLYANSTLLRKISHSSQELRVDNIKDSFDGSDIIRELEGIYLVLKTLNPDSIPGGNTN